MVKDEALAKLFKALSHPLRIKIVKILLDGEKCVCELNQLVEYSQPNLSQHLKILKDAGVVETQKRGLNIHYRIKNEYVNILLKDAEKIILSNLQSLTEV
ncbi:ArsR/SmtB family transcription factor [Caldicellulosiruptor morganii]|uniref:Metalloregulator ArsR/SmtB family transcription factor n=1 Tax=Caldicellulosiruptor morganii TaxID=1387555 RepID=A0ABY7BLJ6_9FIRM|nr:metalloregulator ArsR/SmtB family transcription factor [Caldicellulosiruptor morganii]WAM33713.1 metalloregulator ArsR/SmtB family transcription factor [Caldicellulosiruptor morganii]